MAPAVKQWICDRCNQPIESAKEGWLEWLDDEEDKAHSFKIVHQASSSPRKNGCYFHSNSPDRSDVHLSDWVGPDLMAIVLSYFDLGPNLDPDQKHQLRIRDLTEFVELVRRLTIPNYEEARLHWQQAKADGLFDGANEFSAYSQATLREISRAYSKAAV